jgi:hypothetical protein
MQLALANGQLGNCEFGAESWSVFLSPDVSLILIEAKTATMVHRRPRFSIHYQTGRRRMKNSLYG